MKIITTRKYDATIASAVLYHKYVLNFGVFMRDQEFSNIEDETNINKLALDDDNYYIFVGFILTETFVDYIVDSCHNNKDLNIIVVSNDTVDPELVDEMYRMSQIFLNNQLTFVYDDNQSLSMLSWILSRYDARDMNVSRYLHSKPYETIKAYEHLVFDNDLKNMLYVPWLIRFVTDYVLNTNKIPETLDFYYGFEKHLITPYTHERWNTWLDNDRDIMQIMAAGRPIREYFEHKQDTTTKQEETKSYNALQKFVIKLFKL
jgi:hypothetical protein